MSSAQNDAKSNISSRINDKYPVIMLSGVTADITFQLKQRGFMPQYLLPHNSNSKESSYIVTITPMLFVKLAIESGFGSREAAEASDANIQRISALAIDVLFRMKTDFEKEQKSVPFENCWIIHDEQKLAMITDDKSSQELFNNLNTYFGSKIALYFAWLSFYTHYLVVPAIVGTLLFSYQTYTGLVDTIWSPFFMLLVVLWGTCFLEFWKRENSILCFGWNVLDADEEYNNKELLKASKIVKQDRLFRFAFSIPIITSLLLIILRTMIYFMHEIENADSRYGSDSYMKYYPTVIYAAVPLIAGMIYNHVAVWLNDFEMHPSKHIADDFLILKLFIFQFVNRYCGLLYTAFYLRDMSRLRSLLATMLIVNAFIDNLNEMFAPIIEKYSTMIINKIFKKKSADTKPVFAPPRNGTSLNKEVDAVTADSLWREIIVKETMRPDFDIRSDYLEMILQYGYCTMFAVAFPIAPALALINNLFEFKIDIAKLARCKRPTVVNRSSIGSWYTCLSVVNYMSVLTNCFLLCVVSNNLKTIIPSEYDYYVDLEYGRFTIMVILEHIILLLKVTLSGVIEDVPVDIQNAIAKQKTETKYHEMLDRLANFSYISKEDVNKSKSVNSSVVDRLIAGSKLSGQYGGNFGYNPLFLIGVFIAPVLLQALNVSPFYYIPFSIVFFTYLKIHKDRKDRKAAAGIVSDENVLKYVLEEMPSWVKFADVERVQWLNAVLQKLWPRISVSTKKVIMENLQPVLDSSRPAFLTSLHISKFDLGTLAPRIAGIRNIQTEESIVRLDIELVWSGNPEIELEVGRKSLPLTLELSDIFIKANLRLELTPLISRFPCFGSITLCCMGKPTIDFSFKVGALDVMNIGAADYNVAVVVANVIKSILSSFLVYPKKYVLPMTSDVDMKALTTPSPVGLLRLTVVKAKSLDIADVLTQSSDPYVVIKFMESVFKTEIKQRTLNPVWNETFDIMIFDKETQFIDISVYDSDVGSIQDDFIGQTTLYPSKIPNYTITEIELPLRDCTGGILVLSCEYLPLMKKKIAGEEDIANSNDKDILFALAPDSLTNDILKTSPLPLVPGSKTVTESESGPSNPNFAKLGLATASLITNGLIKAKNNAIASIRDKKGNEKPGVLTVSHIHCRNLRSTSMLTSTVKPFVVATIENVSKNTLVQSGIKDPSFDETFNFVVRDASSAVLRLRVMDEYKLVKNVCLGEIYINISDLIVHHSSLEQEYLMGGKNDESYISCKLEWSSTLN